MKRRLIAALSAATRATINTSPFAPPSGGAFQSFTTPSFTTAAGQHTIEFRGTNAGDNTAFLDKVTLQ